MTQGSTMQPQSNPAQEPVITSTPNVIEEWRSTKYHSASEHAAYALARLIHGQKKHGELTDNEFIERAMKKLVRTFSPKRHTPLPFKALHSALLRCSRLKSAWNLSEEEVLDIATLAHELILEAKVIGPGGLMKLAAPLPPPREKKPYVRPE